MPLNVNKERFIPYRRSDIVRLCVTDQSFSEADRNKLQDVCELIKNIYHFQFHTSLETLKDCYAPVNPDADTKVIYTTSAETIHELEATLIDELKKLLNTANFEMVTTDDLNRAITEESLFKIKLNVDFEDFDNILFFRRGESSREETLSSFFGLRKKTIEFINYDRVIVVVKYKPQDYFDAKNRQQLYFKPGSTIIKLFRNVPRSDLEMLFPNTEVGMKTIDKLIIGVPAAIGGVIMLATKLGTTLLLCGALFGFWLGVRSEPVVLDQTALLALAAGFGTLGAFLWKQFSNFKNRKIRFMKTLADNLYFKNLDNNIGVFHRLIDAAEEEECKESILAFYFLLKIKKPVTADQLDKTVENYFLEMYQHDMDFEISDALEKLIVLGLVECKNDLYSAISLEKAREILDQIWDDYFTFNQQTA